VEYHNVISNGDIKAQAQYISGRTTGTYACILGPGKEGRNRDASSTGKT
jgi:hypothetical protein